MAASTSTLNTEVIIIGGGIGGLTLATILRKLKIPCLVLERSEKINPVGAGISLAPNALAALEQLGLYEHIMDEGQPLRGIMIHRDKTLWRNMDWTWVKNAYGYPIYSIERHRFHHLLYEAAGEEENVRLGSQVVDFIDDPKLPYVAVKLVDGQEITGQVIVGADGIRSVTRRLLGQKAGMESVNTTRFTGRVHMSGYTAPMENLGPKELGVANWIFYDKSILTTWPCVENRQWFIGVKGAELHSTSGAVDRSVWGHTTSDMVAEAYGEHFHPFAESGRFSDIVYNAERVIASNVFEETEFPTMSSGRVALLGDAAHSMTSFFGQGACQAVEDATELANSLQEYFGQRKTVEENTSPYWSLSRVLKEYSEKREPRTKDLVKFSASYAKVHTANLAYGLGPLVRRVVFSWMPVWGWKWALNWLYGYQPKINNLPLSRTQNT